MHRTFLAREGHGKAPVEPARMMLGPCRGGAVRLGEPGDVLTIGEGIETCLAAMQATGHPAWAAGNSPLVRSHGVPSRAALAYKGYDNNVSRIGDSVLRRLASSEPP